MTTETASLAPVRHQRSRRRGARCPLGAVYIGRGSRWGNPYREQDFPLAARSEMVPWEHQWRQWALGRFANALAAGDLPFGVDEVRRDLAGCDLVCWCPLDLPCHGDVLLRVAAGGDPR